jgi:hypothetical protein
MGMGWSPVGDTLFAIQNNIIVSIANKLINTIKPTMAL